MELLNIARKPAVTMLAGQTVAEAAARMALDGVGAVVIVDDQQRVLGIFSERDNLLRVTNRKRDPQATPLSDVMTEPVISATPGTTVEQGLGVMIRKRLRHLPIVDAANHVLGMASLRYVLLRHINAQDNAIETLAAYVTAGGPG